MDRENRTRHVAATVAHCNTHAMRGRPGPGALIGVAVGASLVFFLIWLPEALLGGDTEGGAMFYMGLPLMTISTAVGALIGVPDSSMTRDEPADAARRPLLKSRAVVAIVAGTAVVLAEWFFLMATGAISSLL